MNKIISLEEFNSELMLLENDDEILNFTRKYVIHGVPYIFYGYEEKFFDFRKKISDKWNVIFNEVFITGSAKLGFSYYKNKNFDENSDIDIAIISPILFDRVMLSIENFQWKLRNKEIVLTENEVRSYNDFLRYLVIGWIRPDKLPVRLTLSDCVLKSDWFDFFKEISNGRSEVGNYQVNAGIYKDYFHFERYVLDGVKKTILTHRNKPGI